MGYDDSGRELDKDDFIHNVDPSLMLPPPYYLDWVLKKVAEVKKEDLDTRSRVWNRG